MSGLPISMVAFNRETALAADMARPFAQREQNAPRAGR
jgi:hypothetical protein